MYNLLNIIKESSVETYKEERVLCTWQSMTWTPVLLGFVLLFEADDE